MLPLTFLMTDVEGSTRLWEEMPKLMPEIVERHEAILADAVHENFGRRIRARGEGDSTFNVFESPTAAVSAAIAAQRALEAETWPGGAVLRVRMGIHLGE